MSTYPARSQKDWKGTALGFLAGMCSSLRQGRPTGNDQGVYEKQNVAKRLVCSDARMPRSR